MATRFNAPAAAPRVAAAGQPVNIPPPPKLSYPSWVPSTSWASSIFSFIFFSALVLFVLFLILLAIHYMVYPIFSFLPGDGGIIPVPTVSDKQVAFDKAPAGNDVSGGFTNVVPTGYTIGMDLYIQGGFVQQNTPRVILYNSASAVTAAADTPSKFPTTFPSSNLIMSLDSTLNDLYISAITHDSSGSTTFHVETSPPIVNIPINKVFRITCVYNASFIEIYMNGALQTTMALQHIPITPIGNFWFGQTSSRSSVRAGNVYYWNRILTSGEVRAAGSPVAKDAFFK